MIKKVSIKKVIKAPFVILALGAFFISTSASAQLFALNTNKKKAAPAVAPATPAPTAAPMQMSKGPLQRHSVGLGIGQTFLHGKFDDFGEDKITWDLFYNYSASHSFDFIANFHISSHEYQDFKVDLSALALGLKAKIFNFDKFSPYAIAGLGFYQPKVTRRINGNLVTSESKLTFGTHMGVGAELRLNDRVMVGLLGHYHNPFDIRQDDQPEVEGSYFKLLITSFYIF